MFRALALSVLFAAAPMANVQAEARSELVDAYKAVLTDLAHMRVEWQLCNDYLPTSLRDITEIILNTGERFQLLTRQQAVDFVNDAQGVRRAVVGSRCGPSRVGGDPLGKTLDKLHRMLGVPKSE